MSIWEYLMSKGQKVEQNNKGGVCFFITRCYISIVINLSGYCTWPKQRHFSECIHAICSERTEGGGWGAGTMMQGTREVGFQELLYPSRILEVFIDIPVFSNANSSFKYSTALFPKLSSLEDKSVLRLDKHHISFRRQAQSLHI